MQEQMQETMNRTRQRVAGTRRRLRRSIAIAVLAGLGWQTASAEDAIPEDAKPMFMFVHTADDLETDPQASTLRLVKVSQQTLYFSDRPIRIAGHVTMADYLKEWSEGEDNFGEDPPNATLSVYEPGHDGNVLAVVEITKPVVDGADLVYHYELIEGKMPKAGGPTSLFIDWIGPGGGVGPGFHGVGAGARGPGLTRRGVGAGARGPGLTRRGVGVGARGPGVLP